MSYSWLYLLDENKSHCHFIMMGRPESRDFDMYPRSNKHVSAAKTNSALSVL